MSQTVVWSDITDQIRSANTSLHDRVVQLMSSLDRRYRALGRVVGSPSENRSRLTEWVNKGRDGHRVRVMGAAYAEEPGGPLRRVFGVLHDPVANSTAWTNMRVEILGVDHEHSEHCGAHQWTAAAFEHWFRDLRRALIGLAISGDPMARPHNPPCVRLKAYLPPTMDWEPMKAYQDYIFSELENRRGGSLFHPSGLQRSAEWVDYDFLIDWS